MDDSIVAGAAILISFLTLVGSGISFLLSRGKERADRDSVYVGMASDLTGDALALVEALNRRVSVLESDLVAERTARQLAEGKIEALELRVKILEKEKAELSEENGSLLTEKDALTALVGELLAITDSSGE